jgi:hypothetical protein
MSDWLSEFFDLSKQVKLPVGGELTLGLIAPWRAGVFSAFYSDQDLALTNTELPQGERHAFNGRCRGCKRVRAEVGMAL